MRPLFYSEKWGEKMAYDGSLIFDTKIDRAGFEKGVKGLGTLSSKAFGAITKTVVGVGTAIGAIGIASIKVGTTFESSMSNVAATMGITVDEINKGSDSFDLLKEAAKEAGKTTKYSASESAEALNYLALAGYDAEKSVKALPTVLNLAAAGALDLGYASDLVTDSMSALGMGTDELEGFVDELAKTSQKSNTNIAQLGEAILNIGGTAKIMAGGTVELNTQLGILADSGIKGAEGGTALRNVLLSLSAPTDKQAKEMKRLGIETYDANGNFRSTDDIFQDLNGTLGEMTEKQRTEVLSNLFNKVDLKSANALLSGSGERFGELSSEIANADGAAANMAETLNNNLRGKIGLLKSALEGLGIEIYESVDSPLTSVVDTATEMIGRLTDVFEKEGVAGLVRELGVILSEMILEVAKAAPKLLNAAVSMIKAFISGIMDNKDDVVNSAIEITTLLINTFLELIPLILDLGIDVVLSLIGGMLEKSSELQNAALELIDTILNKIIDNLPLILEMGMKILIIMIEGILKQIPFLLEAIAKIIEAIVVALLAHDWKETGITLILLIRDGIISTTTAIIKAIFSIGQSMIKGFWEGLGNISDIGMDIIKGIWAGMDSMGGWIVDKVVGLAGSVANGFKNFFGIKSPSTLMSKFGVNIVEGLAVGIKEKQSIAEKAMYDMAQSIVKEYDRLGDAVISALKFKYREEERLQLDSLKVRTDILRDETAKRLEIYDKEFQAKLKVLNIETSEEMKALQEQIDAINNKTKEEEKELRDQEYNNKISLKEKEILEANSNEERLKLQAELNQMKAERERQLLLEEREMQINALREEMDRVRTQGEEKRKELDEEYKAKVDNEKDKLNSSLRYYENEMEATKNHYAILLQEENLQAEARRMILDENNQELVELLDSYNPYWQNAGQSFGESLLTGLNSMKASIEAEIAEILSLISEVDRQNANLANQNSIIIQAKKDWEQAKANNDKKAMDEAHRKAEEARASGGTIGNVTLDEALKMRNVVQSEMNRVNDAISGNRSTTINNDNGLTQNNYFNQPVKSPSETAREIKKVGRELVFD